MFDVNIQPSTLGFVVVGVVIGLIVVGYAFNSINDWISPNSNKNPGNPYIALGIILIVVIVAIFVIWVVYNWGGNPF